MSKWKALAATLYKEGKFVLLINSRHNCVCHELYDNMKNM